MRRAGCTPRPAASRWSSSPVSGRSAMVVPVRPVASLDRPSGSRIASSVRWASTSSTRSRTRRRATNRIARSESMSAHCASSTTMATGAFCSSSASASSIRAPTPTGSSTGSERSRPARSRAALTPATRMSWSTTPYATNASHCSPVARSTVRSDSSSSKRSRTAVLPIPGGPSSRTTRGRPERTAASSPLSAVSSARRPTKDPLPTVWSAITRGAPTGTRSRHVPRRG